MDPFMVEEFGCHYHS